MKPLAFFFMMLVITLGPARAQVSEINVADEVDPFVPIVATCDSTVPEGSEIKIRWNLVPIGPGPEGKMIQVGQDAHVWASPGTYKIMASVVWMSFEEVEVSTGDGTKKKIRNLLAWDVQSYEKTFTVLSPGPGPGPGPSPNPKPTPTPSGFDAQVLAALKGIGSPPSRLKVAEVYSNVAEKANTRRDVYKPALMVDEAKSGVVSSLSPEDLQIWGSFWPKLNEAFRDRKMEEDDTDAFIQAFRELSEILRR